MNKEQIVQKITSRKFISLVVALINAIVVLSFGYSEAAITEVVSVTAACVGYMFAESNVDKANAASSTTAITGTIPQNEVKKMVNTDASAQ